MNTQTAVLLSARLLSVGAVIEAAEILVTRAEYAKGGIYSWDLLRTDKRWTAIGPASGLVAMLFSPRFFSLLMVLQAAVAIFVLAVPAGPALPFAIAALLLFRSAGNVRHKYGLDGSDQMTTIVLISLFLWYAAPGPLAKQVAIWFIAFQSVLAYVSAGIAKVISTQWRSGSAVRDIVNTRTYGNRLAVQVFDRWPALKPIACWGVILFECSFPLALLSPKLAIAYFAFGAAMHLGIAAAMGLNNFLWAFIATYPAIYIAAQDLSHLLTSSLRSHLRGLR